jgi:heat shock protein HslJ
MAKKSLILLMGVLLLAALTTAGGVVNANSSPTSSSSSASPTPHLEGKPWILTSFSTKNRHFTVLPHTKIDASFSDGKVTGSAGCNRYFAHYRLFGNTIRIQPVGSTLMYCAPTGVMTQEATYLGLLQRMTTYTINANELRMSDRTGHNELVFCRQS